MAQITARDVSRTLGLRRHERTGLLLALAAHLGVAGLVYITPPRTRIVLPPERIAVTLAANTGLKETSPKPDATSAEEPAPTAKGLAPSLLNPIALPEPSAAPVLKSLPPPVSPALTKPPAPRPTALPSPRVTASAAVKPGAKPIPAPSSGVAAAPSARPAGASRIGSDFLKGVSSSPGRGTGVSAAGAATIGPAVQSALSAAIAREIKPRWSAPQGADADKLVTILTWNLNRDGSLAGAPRMVRQEGITAANRPQAQRHFEQAVRAVQLAAPFNLPADYYEGWKRVAAFRFDKRLSQ